MQKGLLYLLFALIIHEQLISMHNQIFDIYTAKLWENNMSHTHISLSVSIYFSEE